MFARISNYLCLNPQREVRHVCDTVHCAYIAYEIWDPFGLISRGESGAHHRLKYTRNSNAITLCDRCEIILLPVHLGPIS